MVWQKMLRVSRNDDDDVEQARQLVDLVEMRKTDSFGETRLVPHIPSSS